MTQKQFYHSPAWVKARQAYIDRRIAVDGGICEVCGEALGKIVHHYRIWLNDVNCNDPNISLNPDNFRYECQDCHNAEREPGKERRYRYDKDGNLVSLAPEGLPPGQA